MVDEVVAIEVVIEVLHQSVALDMVVVIDGTGPDFRRPRPVPV
jgi:hypothetical protein